ncbi:hypothetical protein JL720_16129 [Aureococcus anophagefferens]|nr:hypothetical protein JL720_16129 [Aureococcus anophagefferens]
MRAYLPRGRRARPRAAQPRNGAAGAGEPASDDDDDELQWNDQDSSDDDEPWAADDGSEESAPLESRSRRRCRRRAEEDEASTDGISFEAFDAFVCFTGVFETIGRNRPDTQGHIRELTARFGGICRDGATSSTTVLAWAAAKGEGGHRDGKGESPTTSSKYRNALKENEKRGKKEAAEQRSFDEQARRSPRRKRPTRKENTRP